MAKERPLILDDDEPATPRRSTVEVRDTPRFGFEWGLASTFVGGTLLVAGPPVLLFCLFFWGGGREIGLSRSDRDLANVAGVIVCAGALILSVLGLVFGSKGLAHARQSRQPAALAVCGLLLSFAAMIVWLIIGVDWIMIMDSPHGRYNGY